MGSGGVGGQKLYAKATIRTRPGGINHSTSWLMFSLAHVKCWGTRLWWCMYTAFSYEVLLHNSVSSTNSQMDLSPTPLRKTRGSNPTNRVAPEPSLFLSWDLFGWWFICLLPFVGSFHDPASRWLTTTLSTWNGSWRNRGQVSIDLCKKKKKKPKQDNIGEGGETEWKSCQR